MEVMYKAKDLATIRNQNVEDKFVDILRGIKLGGAGLIRETTSESDVYLVSGDLRLLSRRNTDPREIYWPSILGVVQEAAVTKKQIQDSQARLAISMSL
jgi:hypothetical protein